ncbi:SET domain-containing protein [Entamoeba marina]
MSSTLHIQANQYVKEEKYDLAIDCYEKCYEEDKFNGVFPSNISLCYYKLQNYAKAYLYAKLAIETSPEYIKGYYRLQQAALLIDKTTSALIASIKLDSKTSYEKHWKTYYTTSNNVSVKQIGPEMGKGVFSTKCFNHSDIIMSEFPVISSPKILNYNNACSYCLRAIQQYKPNNKFSPLFNKFAEKPTKCKCGKVYCGEVCKSLDDGHELLCGKDAELMDFCFKNNLSHPLCILKIFAIALTAKDIEKALFPFVIFHARPPVPVDNELIPIIEKIFGDKLNLFNCYGGWKFIYSVLYGVLKYNASTVLPLNAIQAQVLKEGTIKWDEGIINDEIALKNEITCFTVEGEGLYKFLNTLNHSCDPNCLLVNVDDTHSLTLIACKEIKEGDELTISYIDNTVPKEKRRSALKKGYSFICQCPKCLSEDK